MGRRIGNFVLMKLFVLFFSVVLLGCNCQKKVSWVVPEESDWAAVQFGGDGSAAWNEGELHLDLGAELTGILYQGELPTLPYELELETRRLNGSDFFCGLTFPVGSADECLTLVVGGWGGGTVGISSIDGKDASQNETTFYRNFEDDQWYAIKLRVFKERIEVEMDGEKVIDLPTEGKELGLRPGMIELCAPMGLAAWQTEAEFRNLRWRSLVD
jgi:hypothetical protein